MKAIRWRDVVELEICYFDGSWLVEMVIDCGLVSAWPRG